MSKLILAFTGLSRWASSYCRRRGPLNCASFMGVAVAADGAFYVSDGYGNNRVVKFSAELNGWRRCWACRMISIGQRRCGDDGVDALGHLVATKPRVIGGRILRGL